MYNTHMKLLTLLSLLAVSLLAQDPVLGTALPATLIDAGTVGDGCTGGLSFLVVGVDNLQDTTLRFTDTVNGVSAPFSCVVTTLDQTIPYVVILRFLEPSQTGNGLRVFSVDMNGKRILDHLDIFKTVGAKNVILERYLIVFPDEGKLLFTFTTHVRSALVSSIIITPLAGYVTGGMIQ